MSKPFLTLRRADAIVPVWVPVLSQVGRDAAACIDYPCDRVRIRSRRLVVFGLSLALVLTVQAWMGAGHAERGRYSDDAAHFMNGLLVRDYLAQAAGSNPMQFAEEYYLHYPKIAPLMWPPLFHVVFGLCLLVVGSPGAVALMLLGLCCAWATVRLHEIVERLAGSLSALIAVGLFLTTPMVMLMTSVVMLDVIIAALSLEAAYWLARFVRSSSSRDAAVFGVFVALACLTKGTGVAAVLLPTFLLPLTGRWDLLRRPGLYFAAGIVLALAVPLLAVSAMFDARLGDFGRVSWPIMLGRVRFFGFHLENHLGGTILTLAALGGAITLARARRRPAGYLPLPEVLLALATAVIAFHLFNPHLASSSRYMTPAIAPLVGLAMVGATAIIDWLKLDDTRRLSFVALMAVVCMATVVTRVELAPLSPLGYRDVFDQLSAGGQLTGRRVLVVSDEIGEGAAVTEAAVRGLNPAPTIIRGSKLLADGTWGTNGQVTHATPAAVMQDLEDLHVDYLLLDRSPAAAAMPYYGQIVDLVEGRTARIDRIEISPGAAAPLRRVELYRLQVKSPGAQRPLRVNLLHTIGRVLER